MKKLSSFLTSALSNLSLASIKGGGYTVHFKRPDGSRGSIQTNSAAGYQVGGVMPGGNGFIITDVIDGTRS